MTTAAEVVDTPLWTFHLGGQHNQESHGGGGNVGPDLDGNTREDGIWLDADGNRLTDSYISDYGKPVTYSGVEDHSLVLSQRGEYHIMRDRKDPTEPDSLVREPRDVKVTGLTQSDVRTIGGDAGSMIDAPAGDSRGTAAGLKLTSDGDEGLTLSDGGSFRMKGNAVDMASAFDTMDDAYDRYDVGSRGVEASALWQFGATILPLTAAARRKPRTVSGPSLQELDYAADQMAALVAVHLGRVAGFAARNLGGVTIAASAQPEPLWAFHLPGKHDQRGHGRAGKTGAVSGRAALDVAPADHRPRGERHERALATSAEERAALDEYANDAQAINSQIRTGNMSPETREIVDQMDGVMARSPLSSDIEVHRGLTDGRAVFGDKMAGDLAGATWTEAGFSSTSADPRIAENFAGMFDGRTGPPTVMRIVAPEGTGAITMSDWGTGSALFGGQAEVALDRGLTFRVVADHGVVDHPMIPTGFRKIDVEVKEPTTTVAAAPRSIFSGLWALTAQTPAVPEPGPGTARQAAVSADDLAVIQDTWTVVVTESLAPAIAASYVAAAESQAARLAAQLPAELAEAFAQPLIDTTQASLLYAAEASNRLVAIGDELWSNARTSLVEGMAAGEDIPKLAARVRAATQVTLPRATVIARTEVVGARNAGSYDEMVASGVVTTKRWLATNDRRTRPDHRLAGGLVPGVPAQEVPIGGKFSLGGWPCDHPGDPALPPEQGINCRCSLIYEVGDDETVSQAVANLPVTAALWDFHLKGKHDQSTHGHGGPGSGQDLLAAGHGEAIAQDALAAADANSYDFDREVDDPLAGRKLYRGGGVGPHGDEALHSIADKQGFGGPARKISKKEMDKGIKRRRGGDTVMYRGVRGKEGMTAAQIHERTATGEPHYGLGFSGNGIYGSSSRGIAGSYGTTARYAIHRDAKVVDYRDLQREQATFLDSVGRSSVQGRVFADPGRYAAAKGYDAIRWRRGEEASKKPGEEDEFIVLNRTAILAES